MRDYEIVYIFGSSLTSEEIGAKLERYHAIIAADGPGEVTASVHWGKRQLAYPIRKQPNGYYVVAQFTSAPDPLRELERVLKLEDDVLRYLIVIAEHPLPLPEAAPADEAGADEAAPEAADEAGDGPDAEAGSEKAAEGDAGESAGEAAEAEEADEAEEAADDASSEAETEAEAEGEAEEAEAEAPADDADTERDGAGADAGEPEESADGKEE